jgi:hypothetical protein
VLIERETADISNLSTKEYYEEQRRKITRRVLDVFYLDLGFSHHSASMQMCPTHHLHGAYDRLARENRERLEADRKQEAEELMRLRHEEKHGVKHKHG